MFPLNKPKPMRKKQFFEINLYFHVNKQDPQAKAMVSKPHLPQQYCLSNTQLLSLIWKIKNLRVIYFTMVTSYELTIIANDNQLLTAYVN